MTDTQSTAIIRNRGQLTIPEKIRRTLKWPATNFVVFIRSTSDNTIIIAPYEKEEKKADWNNIEKAIRKLRSYKKIQGSMSEFITEDRYKH